MSHDIRAIFSYVDLIRPDLDLFLALVSYLHGMIVIPSVAFSLSLRLPAVFGLVSAAGKAKESALTFELTLTQHLTLLRKI